MLPKCHTFDRTLQELQRDLPETDSKLAATELHVRDQIENSHREGLETTPSERNLDFRALDSKPG